MLYTLIMAAIHKEPVKVVVRCRPLNEQESSYLNSRAAHVFPEDKLVQIKNSKFPAATYKEFEFDAVYDETATQREIYDKSFRPLVQSVFMGFNATIFAYGQTGAGKTYTMEGDPSSYEDRGIMSNAFHHIFDYIDNSENAEFVVSASYIEIYQEDIRDLLSTPIKVCELRHKSDGAFVQNVTVQVCRDVIDLDNALLLGKKNRKIGFTNMNSRSSRSHGIFTITIECCDKLENEVKIGKLNLVDLAGSERQKKAAVYGKMQKESIKINLSLSALGNVISALGEGGNHVPYRDSKLTRILQDSLGGNAKTTMIANIGPADSNYEETTTTLRYATRARNIQNIPVVNDNPAEALINKYKDEIYRLKSELNLVRDKSRKFRKQRKFKDYESSDTDFEYDELSEDDYIKKREELLKEEKNAILNNQHIIYEQKEKLLNEIKEQEDQLAMENASTHSLLGQIKSMEDLLLSGNGSMIDHTNEQQHQLDQQAKELAETKSRENEIVRKIQELDIKQSTVIKENYTSLKQDVQSRTKKLKKSFSKLQAAKKEINDEQDINSRERQDQQRVQDSLIRQLKYTHLIIDNFVPPEVKEKTLAHSQFNEEENRFYMKPKVTGDKNPRPRPNAADGLSKRPICDYAKKMWKQTHNPQYVPDNIVIMDLDRTITSVHDYEPPNVDPVHKAVLDSFFKENKDACITINANDVRYRLKKRSAHRQVRSKIGQRKQKDDDDEEEVSYPTPRGLVPRH